MKTPLFFIFCIVATFAIIEAVPWFRQNPTKRYGRTESENNGAADFGVDEFGVNGGDTEIKSGGGLTRGDQNPDENQDEGEGVDDQGGDGYQGGRGFQAGRGIQRGRRPQGDLGNKSFESIGGHGNLGGRGYPGTRRNEGRRNQDNGDDSEYYKTSDEDGSFEDAALRWQQERGRFFGNYGRQLHKSYWYPSGSRFQGQGFPSYRDEGHNANEKNNEEESSNDENRRWQQNNSGGSDCGNGISGTFQGDSGVLDTNGFQNGNQNKDENSDVQNGNNENYDGGQNYDGNQNEKGAGKGNRGGNNYGGYNEGQASRRGQALNRGNAHNMNPANESGETSYSGQAGSTGQAGFRGQAGNRCRANNYGENGDKNQDHHRGTSRNSGRIPNIMNIGNGEGNRNTVYFHSSRL